MVRYVDMAFWQSETELTCDVRCHCMPTDAWSHATGRWGGQVAVASVGVADAGHRQQQRCQCGRWLAATVVSATIATIVAASVILQMYIFIFKFIGV